MKSSSAANNQNPGCLENKVIKKNRHECSDKAEAARGVRVHVLFQCGPQFYELLTAEHHSRHPGDVSPCAAPALPSDAHHGAYSPTAPMAGAAYCWGSPFIHTRQPRRPGCGKQAPAPPPEQGPGWGKDRTKGWGHRRSTELRATCLHPSPTGTDTVVWGVQPPSSEKSASVVQVALSAALSQQPDGSGQSGGAADATLSWESSDHFLGVLQSGSLHF